MDSSATSRPDLTDVQLRSMSGAVAAPEHRSANRIDPYWGGFWAQGSQASWESRALAERRALSGFRTTPVGDLRTPAPEAALTVSERAAVARDALGVLAMWRTATTEQIAAFIGAPTHRPRAESGRVDPATTPSSALLLLWQAEMAEQGMFVSDRRELPGIWRPLHTKAVDRLLPELRYRDWVRLTAGQRWTTGPQHDRHNLLGTELGLRIAEFCDVATVLGESVSGHHLLDVTGRRSPGSGAADLVVVRGDGLRIAMEVTANNHLPSLRRKVDRWFNLLGETSYDDCGLIVCLVEAGDPLTRSGGEVISPLRRAVEEAIALRPDGPYRRLPERIAVARWRWWFPSEHTAAPGFATLEAQRPTGRRADRWQPVHLLDITDAVFEPVDQAAFHATIANSILLAGIPHWLRVAAARDHTAPDLDRLVADRSGLGSLIDNAR